MVCVCLIVSSQIITKIEMATADTEIWFYHLERAPVERVLPELLAKTLEKGWRAQVKISSDERIDFFNSHLWTYRPESFLPHGTHKEGPPERQPILLTSQDGNANDAEVLFLIDGAETSDFMSYKRCITMFDGKDDEAVARARAFWKQSKADALNVTYWQQAASGKWEQKA